MGGVVLKLNLVTGRLTLTVSDPRCSTVVWTTVQQLSDVPIRVFLLIARAVRILDSRSCRDYAQLLRRWISTALEVEDSDALM